MIDVVIIDNPRDCSYPFAEALYGDPTVVYHGTSSRNATEIEAEGLCMCVPSLPVREMQDLVAACDAVAYASWSYTTVKGLSRDADLARPHERGVYLSANFFYARDYSTNVGGEAVHNALLLASELLQYLRDKPASTPLHDKVVAINSALTRLTAGGVPVVYAVRVAPEWLQHGNRALERLHIGDLVITETNIQSRVTIPVSCLCAKVEYPAGAQSGYVGPQPPTWAEARKLGQANS